MMKGETAGEPIETVQVMKMFMNGYVSAYVFPSRGTVYVDKNLDEFLLSTWRFGRSVGIQDLSLRSS